MGNVGSAELFNFVIFALITLGVVAGIGYGLIALTRGRREREDRLRTIERQLDQVLDRLPDSGSTR